MIIHTCKSDLLKTRSQTGFKKLQKPSVGLRTPEKRINVPDTAGVNRQPSQFRLLWSKCSDHHCPSQSHFSILEGIPKTTLLTITKVQLEIPQLQNTTHHTYSVRKEEFFSVK